MDQKTVHVFKVLFGVLGNGTAFFLFLSPTITFKRIMRKKCTEQFSGIPYVMTMLNCLLYAWYGLPFVSANNFLVSTVNGTGAAMELIYVLVFIIFAPKRERAKILGLFTAVLALFSAVALVSLFALHDKTRKLFCGLAATVFAIIMFSSPLSIMIPNGCGSVLGALQLILYFIYRDNKGKGSGTTKPNGAATTADESITINGAQDGHV
ncbi:bidirectional sugar transporter SWEET1-like isoform X4 [Malus domestica]|uniref:bidirectional sugar transporter SWEET1-like isoform X4 n=1 Tax=Malus domestica TaxID=3750 RepID=UPI003975630D